MDINRTENPGTGEEAPPLPEMTPKAIKEERQEENREEMSSTGASRFSGWTEESSPRSFREEEEGEEKEKDVSGRDEEEDEEEEEISWDGSQAHLVLEEDAAEYEQAQTGIRLGCSLRPEEVMTALNRSGFSKTLGRRAVVDAVLLGALAVLFFVQHFFFQVGQALFFGVVALVCLGLVFLVPYFGRKKMTQRILSDPHSAKLDCVIYPDSVVLGSGEGRWEIPLDGTCRMETYKKMLLLFPAGQREMVILPLRCIEPSVLPEVQAILEAGTARQEEEA